MTLSVHNSSYRSCRRAKTREFKVRLWGRLRATHGSRQCSFATRMIRPRPNSHGTAWTSEISPRARRRSTMKATSSSSRPKAYRHRLRQTLQCLTRSLSVRECRRTRSYCLATCAPSPPVPVPIFSRSTRSSRSK